MRPASVAVAAEVVAVAPEVEAAQLGFALSEQVALAEEHFVVVPAERLAHGAVAPAYDGSPRSADLRGQCLDGDQLVDYWLGDGLIVRDAGEIRPGE